MLSTHSSYHDRRPRIVPLIIWLLLTVGWMAFIFAMSNQPYQEQDMKPLLASWIAEPSLAAFTPSLEFSYDGYTVSGQQPYDFWEFFIRKGGHVSEFAVLTFLLIRLLGQWMRSTYKPLLWGGMIAYIYACSDEWHQTFITGRTGHFADTLIDAIGIVLVVLIYALIRKRRSQKQGLRFA